MQPLRDQIIIEPDKPDEKTAGGIIIPEKERERPQQGTVLACGPGRISEHGVFLPMDPAIQPGARVVFGKYAGTELMFKDKFTHIVSERDVLGVLVPA